MRVLIATDGSAGAQIAIDLVARRPWQTGTVVRLVAVDDSYGQHRTEIEEHLEGAAALLRRSGRPVEPALLSGRAASTLLADAASWSADLVVAGNRGRGRIRALVLGSVSAELVERARASTLIVRRGDVARLLVAVDGSAASREVAPLVCATGAFAGVQATVISVSGAADPWPPTLDLRAARAATRAAARLAACGVPARRELHVGEPAATIIEQAAATGVDLVAVGSRGLSGLRGLLGSVARNVTYYAPCNVLVARSLRRSPTPGDGSSER
jgi:nucleotide-binding universal stress UspA family protein